MKHMTKTDKIILCLYVIIGLAMLGLIIYAPNMEHHKNPTEDRQ
jgi:hypothetical protein